jgi:hypothetical protein
LKSLGSLLVNSYSITLECRPSRTRPNSQMLILSTLDFVLIYTQLIQSQSQNQSRSYFTTGGLPSISLSWRQAPWDRDQRFFHLNSCGNSPYVTSSLARRWGCLLWICLALSSSVHFARTAWMIVNNELENMRTYAIVGYFQVISQYLSCRNWGKQQKTLVQSVSWPRFEITPLWVQVRSITGWAMEAKCNFNAILLLSHFYPFILGEFITKILQMIQLVSSCLSVRM